MTDKIDTFVYTRNAMSRKDALWSGSIRAKEYFGHEVEVYSVKAVYLKNVYHQNLDPHLKFTLTYKGVVQ